MPATGLGGWGRFGTSCQLWWRQETALLQLWGRTTVTSPFRATSVIISGSDKINQLPELWAPRPTTPPSPHPSAKFPLAAAELLDPRPHTTNSMGCRSLPYCALHVPHDPPKPKTTASPSLTLPTDDRLRSAPSQCSSSQVKGSHSAGLPGSTPIMTHPGVVGSMHCGPLGSCSAHAIGQHRSYD